MKDRSDNPSHHERTLLPRSYISFRNFPNVDTIVYNVTKERIYDTFKQQCYNRIMTTPKGILYKHLVNKFKLQNYLGKLVDVRYLKDFFFFRMFAHKLNLEFGRQRNVERSERKCTFCNLK